MLKDMKSGHPLYPMEQTVPYPSPAVVFPSWGPMLPQPTPAQQQQAPPPIVSGPPPHPGPHPMYSQGAQLRPPIGVFNPAIPSYMQLPHGPVHETGTAFVVPMQQLQQLQIANGHPGPFCLVNAPHPHGHPHAAALFMPTPQPTTAPQPHQQSALPHNDPSLVASQVGHINRKILSIIFVFLL